MLCKHFIQFQSVLYANDQFNAKCRTHDEVTVAVLFITAQSLGQTYLYVDAQARLFVFPSLWQAAFSFLLEIIPEMCIPANSLSLSSFLVAF